MKKKGLLSLNQNFMQAYFVVLLFRLISDFPVLIFGSKQSDITLSMISSILLLLLILGGMLFLLSVLNVGMNAFYLNLNNGTAEFRTLWCFFTKGPYIYFSIIKGMFLRYFSICAGSLLLIIPGILQYYSTFFVPWILAESPETTAAGAMQKSRKMTAGQRMNIFVMQLTFIGWLILSFMLAQRFTLWLPASLGPVLSAAIYALPMAYYQSAVAALYTRLDAR